MGIFSERQWGFSVSAITAAAQLGHGVETAEQELARLRAENKALRATEARLSTERDILRSAAKYFAGETNW